MLTLGFVTFQTSQGNIEPHWDLWVADPFFQILAITAGVTFVSSRVVLHFLFPVLARASLATAWTEDALRSARTSKGHRTWADNDIPQLLRLVDKDQKAVRLFGPYFISKIIQFALTEAVAMFGFVLATAHQSVIVFGPFAAVALLGFLLSRPTQAEFEAIISR
ncbi:MAG: hypothetical protein AB7P49_15490 [Bdellovibrionales bacterium]